MKKFLIAIVILLTLIICCGSCAAIFYFASQMGDLVASSENEISFEYYSGDLYSTNKILLVKVNGIILDTSDDIPSLFTSGYVFGYEIKDMLYKAAEDDEIKGVLLLINSPGGTVLGSRAIVDGIEYYKETTGNPVYGYIQGFAASGAYMAASASDKLSADYGTLTGSIGVIFGTPFQYYDKVTSQGTASEYVVTQNGIETFYVSAGEYKDIGSPYRKMTSEELESLQSNIDNEYEQFVDLVSANRDLSTTEIRDEIKALIYGNTQAIELGLIDGEATYDQVVLDLVGKIGIADNYQIITTKSNDIWSALLSSLADKNQLKTNYLQNRILLIFGDPALYE